MKILIDVLLVACFGAIGAVSRFGITQLFAFTVGKEYPLGTLVANVLGCLLMGLLFGVFGDEIDHRYRAAIAIGFLGSLTTFSTFAADIVSEAQQQRWVSAFSVVALSLLLGVGALVLGLWLGRRWVGS